ncbi:glycosyltransferase [Blastochloris sulfoviridis]|uniref:Glycosyltransferase n=2 Tax=Blastochloris sulfoviridis TaxID=50712 RepID=A0A5M6HNF4_9HYPH|nr:glycosyltransferase [Blastochloris sulfoviridis]
MNASGQIICLNMIVKNEASVIRRCLDSVRPIINRWVIVDTGSTDGTQDIIREHLRDLPGELHERPWRNFAHNRTEALELARGQCDYALIIDADDTLEIEPGTVLPFLTADSYMMEIRISTVAYRRPQLVRAACGWRYEGVLHEFLTCEVAGPPGLLTGMLMRSNPDGARRQDPRTYQRDAAVLEEALRTETDPFLITRYRFYLAQSYRDCRALDKALENYLIRAGLGYWQEEVFISLYCAAQLKEQLGHSDQDVIDAYRRAANAQPTRAEALYKASRFCRFRGLFEDGYDLAKRGLAIEMPADGLFVEPWVYDIGLLDELALNAYWSGRYRDSLDASLKLLATGKLAATDMPRVVENARFASAKLPRDASLGSLGTESLAEQHALRPPRPLRSRLNGTPRVLVSIIAGQDEDSLPLYLQCIEALDYPKSSIVLSVLTFGSTDAIERRLHDWAGRIKDQYAGVEFDAGDAGGRVKPFILHERTSSTPRSPGHWRKASFSRAQAHGCDFCFVADADTLMRPCTLRELVALNLPIVAPFLRAVSPDDPYSNYHAEIDANGYFENCDQYSWVLNRRVRGVLEMPVVNGSYLVRADVMEDLAFEDGTARLEYVVLAESARKRSIPQYLDNRQVYGYVLSGKRSAAPSIEKLKDLFESEMPNESGNEYLNIRIAG